MNNFVFNLQRFAKNISNSNSNTIITGTSTDDSIYNEYTSNVTIKSGDGNDSISGISETDTLKITGAEYTTTKSGDDLIIGVGSSKIKVIGGANVDFTIDGTLDSVDELYIEGTSGADSISNSSAGATIDALAGNDTIKNYYASNVKIDAGAGDDYVENWYDSNVTMNAGEGNDSIRNVADSAKIDAGAGNDYIYNYNYGFGSASIKAGAGNDSIYNYGGSNVTIDASAGNDYISLNSSNNLIQYANGDGNDIIYGIKSNDTVKITGAKYSTEKSGSDLIVGVDSGNITVVGGASINFKIDGTLKGGEDTTPAGWKFTSTLATATLAKADDLDLNDTNIKNVNASKTTNGIEIIGNDLNNSIKGGKGADLISGGSGNDTVSLGAGADTYIYSGGNDLIQDYATVDAIKFETEIENASLSGSNLIITTAKGKVTVKGGKDKNISVIDSNDETLTILNEYPIEEITLPDGWKYGTASKTNTNAEIITATLKTAENIDLTENYGEGVVSINAAKITGGVKIIGNDLNNSIKGSKGADYISGGSGNDTVSLGGGADVYIYSGGNDLVQDYATLDSIYLDKDEINISKTKGSVSGSNYIIKTDKGNLTLKGAASKSINLFDTSGKAISLSTTSKNVAENVWFLEDDNNFETCAIDDITENKFAVTEIQNYNNETFAQDDNILTFAKEK